MQYFKDSIKKFSTPTQQAIENGNTNCPIESPQSPTVYYNAHEYPPVASPIQQKTTRIRPDTLVLSANALPNNTVALQKQQQSTSQFQSQFNQNNNHKRNLSESSFVDIMDGRNNFRGTNGRGHINHGFAHSTNNLNNGSNGYGISQPNVYREQYWSWSCRLSTWTKREKYLLMVIGFLTMITLGLIAVVSVLANGGGDVNFGLGPPGLTVRHQD